MKECIVDIKLLKFPAIDGGRSKNSSNCLNFHNRREGFKVINSFNLGESFGDKASLVSFHTIIGEILDFEDPFAPNGSSIRRSVHDILGLIHCQSFNLWVDAYAKQPKTLSVTKFGLCL